MHSMTYDDWLIRGRLETYPTVGDSGNVMAGFAARRVKIGEYVQMAGDGKPRKNSWKAKAHSQRAKSPSTRWIGRFLSTLLAAALLSLFVGLFIFFWRSWSVGSTKVFAIYPDAADVGQSSWLAPFAKQDCQAFEENTNLKRANVKVIGWNDAGFGSARSKKIDELNCEKNDVLVVYVTGVGISHGKKACIVCRDADLRPAAEGAAVEGLVEVGKLLKQVGRCAGKKLLILDVACLENDPRLGMLVNEFPLLLEEDVKNYDGADLWVLNSTALFQVRQVLYSQRRSLFGMAVEEALQSGADSNGDGKVRLLEFYDSVIRRCTSPVPAEEGAAGQTPLLMYGSPGIVRSKTRIKWKGDNSRDPILIRVAASGNREEKRVAPASKELDKPAPAEPAKTSSRTAWRDLLGMAPGGHLAVGGRTPAGRPGDALGASGWPRLERSEAPAGEESGQRTSYRNLIAIGNGALTGVDTSDVERAGSPPGLPFGPAPATLPAADSPVKDSPVKDSPVNGSPGKAAPGKGQEPQARPVDAAGAAADQPASSPQDAPQNLKNLIAAWRLRDEIQDRKLGDHWSAVDFGPHHWRSLNARLLAIEQGLLAAADSVEGQRSLQDILAVLNELRSAMHEGRPSSRILDEPVIEAWNQFYNDRVDNKQSSANGPVALLQQEYADLFWQSVCLVRWYDYASLTDASRSAGTSALPIKQFLAGLANFGREIENHVRHAADRRVTQKEIQNLTSQCNDLKGQRDKILEVIAGDVSKSTGVLKEEGAGDGRAGDERNRAERLAADLLSTPLLSADQRLALYAVLQFPRAPAVGSAAGDALPEAKWPSGEGSEDQWLRLQDRTELQIGLISLAGRAQADRLAGHRPWEKFANPRPADSEELVNLLHEYHVLGREIGKSLADLSQEIPIRKSDRYHAWRLAQLADPRDYQLNGPMNGVTQVFLDLNLRVRQNPGTIRLASGNSVLPVFEDDVAALLVSAEDWPRSYQKISVALRFDEKLLEVRTQDDRPLNLDKQLLVPMTADTGKGDVVLNVRWKGPRSPPKDARQTALSAEVPAGDELASSGVPAELICEHRGSRPIELAIRRHGKGKPVVLTLASGGGTATLETFPGRSTWFDFALASKAPDDIIIEVQLLAVPAVAGTARGRGALGKQYPVLTPAALRSLLLDTVGACKKELVIALAAQDGKQQFPLPAAARNLSLSFKRPERAAPANGAPPAQEKPKTPGANSERPLPANWDGRRLACVISTSNPAWKWIYLLDLELLDPQRFLEPKVGYDRENQKIDVGLTVSSLSLFSDLIADLAKNPFHVELKPKGELPEGGIAADLQDSESHLAWGAPPDGRSREFELDLAGYPRAFRYRVSCENDQEGVNVTPAEPGVRIRSVQAVDGSQMKYVVDGFALSSSAKTDVAAGGAAGAAAPIAIALAEKDEWAAFPAESRELRVVVAVDPPGPDRGSIPRVRLENSGKPFLDGRYIGGGAEYKPQVRDDGAFAIVASVTDHEFSIPVSSVKATAVDLVAELIWGVDGDEPIVDRVPVVIGPRKLEIELSASDQSGKVATVVAGTEVRLSVTLRSDEATGRPKPNAGISSKRVVISIKGGDDKVSELKEEEELTILEQTKFQWTAKWKVTEKLAGQKCTLTARVTDGFGRDSQDSLPLVVKSPAGKTTTGSAKPVTKGTIRVSRRFLGNAIEEPKLEEAPDRRPALSKDQQYWEFTGLEMDQGYTVTAETIHDGKIEVLTSDHDVKPTDPDKPRLVKLAPKKKEAVPKPTP